MTTTSLLRTSAPAAALAHLVQTTQRVRNALQRERRLSATLHTLRGLSDRTLRDIGLKRHDIADVVRDRCRER